MTLRATKLTVGIVPAEDAGFADLRHWFSEGTDIRYDAGVAKDLSSDYPHSGGAFPDR